MYILVNTYRLTQKGLPRPLFLVMVSADVLQTSVIIPVTRRVKRYARFVGKYETGRRKCFRPHKYIYS